MHPHKSEGVDSHNAKLRRMTRHYGEANPSMNIKTPQERMKIEGPEPHHGFGSDYTAANARSDKPARRSVAANPLATYKRGGKVCEVPVVATRARGGRLHGKHKGSTHINVVVAPQGQGAAPSMAPPPQLAALTAPRPPVALPPVVPPPTPPMAPPGGPMGGRPMGAPPSGAPMIRKRGGHVTHSDQAQDKALIHRELKNEGLIRRERGGGVKTFHMEGGSASGPGREDKNEHWAKYGDKKKQTV